MSFTHGTYDAYNNHGCRCEECKRAAREYRQSMMTDCPGGCGRKVHGRYRPDRLCRSCVKKKPLIHGTESGYQKGCRCDRCRAASTAGRTARKRKEARS